MSNYHVTYDQIKKKWKVIKEGGSSASGYFDAQKEAEQRAKQLSANSGGGEVIIHRKDNGLIRDSDTVFPGNDPSSIKDKKH